VFEHAVLALRLVLPYAMPPMSLRVQRRQARDDGLLAALQMQAAAREHGGWGTQKAGGGTATTLASPPAILSPEGALRMR